MRLRHTFSRSYPGEGSTPDHLYGNLVCNLLEHPDFPRSYCFIRIEILFQHGHVVKIVMGPVQKIWPGPGGVHFLLLGSGEPSLVWVWKISPKNTKFSFFSPLGQKNLFRSGQKYAQAGSGKVGPGPISRSKRHDWELKSEGVVLILGATPKIF